MFSVLLLCVIFCACAVLAYREYGRKSGHPLPPTLSGALPIIGHAALLIGDTTKLWLTIKKITKECMKKGGVVSGYMGTDLSYIITDPDDALTAANACIDRHYMYSFLKPWLGDGLLTSSGEIWHRHRKLLNPAFAVPVIHGFLDIFNQISKQLVCNVECHVGKHPFDHNSYLNCIHLQSICRTAFAMNETEFKDFANEYMHITLTLSNMAFNRMLNVFLHNNFIYKLSGLQKEEKKLIKTLNDMVNPVIIKQMEAVKKLDDAKTSIGFKTSGSRQKPLVNLLVGLPKDDALTPKEIREELDTALIVSSDTTTTFLTYLMVVIGSYPKVQQRMYEEIMEVIGADKDVEKYDLKKLVYIEAVIKETLRLIPLVPVIARYVDKDVKLKNYTMRAGSHCFLFLLGSHLDPRYGEDVEDFRPERWLDPAVSSLGNSIFYGFSLGKRSCIGVTYAMASIKVTLAHFLRRYKVTGDMNKLTLKLENSIKAMSAAISIDYRN